MRRPIYTTQHVGVSFREALEVLRSSPSRWLPPPAEADGEESWRVSLATDGVLSQATVPVVVRLDPLLLTADGHTALIRVRWQAAAASSLFPTFEGDLEADAISQGLTELTLLGHYRPPMSVLGQAGDRVAGRHVANAVLRRFVERIATNVEREVSSTLAT
jgi:hypothetical protein